MARSVRHLTEIAAHLAERGIDLVVLKQGIDTTTPAGRFTFHVLAAMDEMLADLISEGTREGLESARARGRAGGRKPKLTARQAEAVRGMYEDKGADDKHEYTVAETAEAFGVSAKPSTGTSNHPVTAASQARRPHCYATLAMSIHRHPSGTRPRRHCPASQRQDREHQLGKNRCRDSAPGRLSPRRVTALGLSHGQAERRTESGSADRSRASAAPGAHIGHSSVVRPARERPGEPSWPGRGLIAE